MSILRIRRLLSAVILVCGALAGACSEPTSIDGNSAPPSETPSEIPSETPSPAGAVHVAPDTVTMEPGDSMYFVAFDSLTNGSVGAATVEWSATAGTVDSSGLYRAPSEPGSYRVIAKSANGTDSAVVVVASDVAPAIALAVSTLLLDRDETSEPQPSRGGQGPVHCGIEDQHGGDLHLPAGLAGDRRHDHGDGRVYRANHRWDLFRHRESLWRRHRRYGEGDGCRRVDHH